MVRSKLATDLVAMHRSQVAGTVGLVCEGLVTEQALVLGLECVSGCRVLFQRVATKKVEKK